jgi:hypothetical protein
MNGDITTSHFLKVFINQQTTIWMRVWWKKSQSMLCWMNVNWMIVVRVEIESCK